MSLINTINQSVGKFASKVGPVPTPYSAPVSQTGLSAGKQAIQNTAPASMSFNKPAPQISTAPRPTVTSTTRPTNGLINGVAPDEYARIEGMFKPKAPTSPSVSNQVLGSQYDANGDMIYPLTVNPFNEGGAIPSSKIGNKTYTDVLSKRNFLQDLQDKIVQATLQSPEEAKAKGDLLGIRNDQLDVANQRNQELDRLASTGMLTKEQAQSFLTETNRRAQATLANLAVRENASANTYGAYNDSRKNVLDSLSTLYNIQKPQEVGGNLINPMTGEVLYQGAKSPISVSAGETIIDPTTGEVLFQGDPKSDLTPYQQFQATLAIRNSTTRLTDASRELQRQSTVLTDTWNRYARGEAKDLNATSQAIVTTFNKLLDPTSVVREAEYDRSSQGQALLSAIAGKVAAVSQGGPGLTPQSLKELVDLGNLYASNAQQSINKANQDAQSLAQQFGLNPSFVTTPGYQAPAGSGTVVQTKAGPINVDW